MIGDKLFTLKIKLNRFSGATLIVDVTEGPIECNVGTRPTHQRINIVARYKGRVIIRTFGGIPLGHAPDGILALELALACLTYTDEETCTELHRAFVRRYGDEIDNVRESRYCDREGNVKENQ